MNKRILPSIVFVVGLTVIGLSVTLRTDIAGAEAGDSGSSNWCDPIIVDSAGGVGKFASLALVDGHPAITYYDETNGDLMYVRAGDPYGIVWGTPIPVDTEGNVGTWTSLTVVNGHPAIAYHDYSNHRLKYVRASDATGDSWGTPIAIADTSTKVEIAGMPSLAVVDGHPAIAYYFAQPYYNLRYVRANDPTGATWGSPVNLDDWGTGNYPSLAVVDSRPAVAYYHWWLDDLRYVRANDTAGASWGSPVTVDSPGDVGWYSSLAVVDGRPAIGYFDWASNKDLKYARANDASGDSWGSPIVVDSVGDVGRFGSMAVIDGHPAMAYYDETDDVLKYVRASDAAGTSWDSPIILDSISVVSVSPFSLLASLADINGSPAIVYYDETNADLKFVSTTCKIEVAIDIRPGRDPNYINPKGRGKTLVAILSTPAFDAPNEVDKTSLTFGRTGDEQSLDFCLNFAIDVNYDDLLDQVCLFRNSLTGFQLGDTEGVLKGQTVDGTPIEGRDSVWVVPPVKMRVYKATLSGDNEVPPVETDAIGNVMLKIDGAMTGLRYRIDVLHLKDVTAAHIHCGPAGANGPVGVTLFSGDPTTKRTFKGTVTAPDDGNACGWTDLAAVVGAMWDGDTYVNVHTLAHPSGEIRGQIEAFWSARKQRPEIPMTVPLAGGKKGE
jgi:hypothetical protein